ncbi:DUF11 domain-containing protein [Deinococcus yavapaiensis]|uniref:Putative repeat protein (TIGR01451 family) n=1 Tax=Deinococcus yavapaiensis KR-236 TaxID=694435 RepID=A0A318ST31_9DEIO|nr:DUF11 domain-containing protein [Deinococcus yavapaiensis]PYE56366.1 putative repeat protein (TIGR01451 family) [Deinococcus yavapaiensis KR-236]
MIRWCSRSVVPMLATALLAACSGSPPPLNTDLAVQKVLASPTPNLLYGQPATYTITVTNNGPNTYGGTIGFVDAIPAGMTFTGVSSPWTCAPVGAVGPANVVCTRPGPLAPSASVSAAFTVSVAGPAVLGPTVKNCARLVVPFGDQNNANNNACVTNSVSAGPPPGFDLKLQKTAGGALTAGGTGTYTFTVANLGPSPVPAGTTITLTDNLPAGLTFGSMTNPWVCTGTTSVTCGLTLTSALPASGTQSGTMTVNVAASVTGVVQNCATISTPGDTNVQNDRSCIGTDVVQAPQKYDLILAKTVAHPLTAGMTGAYTFTITNLGPGFVPAGTVLTITDNLVAGLTFASITPPWVCTGATSVTCTLTLTSPLPMGGTLTATMTVNVAPIVPGTPPPGQIRNCAAVGAPGDSNAQNDQGCVTSDVVTPTTQRLWVGSLVSLYGVGFDLAQLPTAAPGGAVTPNHRLTNAPGNGTQGLAFDAAGNLWMSREQNSIACFQAANLSGVYTTGPNGTITSPALSSPWDIAFDPSGNLWVANGANDTVVKFNAGALSCSTAQTLTPSVVLSSSGGSLSTPRALAFDAAANLWVVNETGSLVRFAAPLPTSSVALPASTTLTAASPAFNTPRGLAFDAAGNAFVTNAFSDTLMKFTPSQLASGGTQTPTVNIQIPATYPCELTGPAFDWSGNLWVSCLSSLVRFTPADLASSGTAVMANLAKITSAPSSPQTTFIEANRLAFTPKPTGLPLYP